MMVLGTTISLMFTVTVAALLDAKHRAADRRLTTMMVISAIGDYGEELQNFFEMTDRNDSVAQWLLSRPVEEIEMLPEDELSDLEEEGLAMYAANYDDTYEKIFSNNFDTWKNLRNRKFIGTVGLCFALMRNSVEQMNQWSDESERLCIAIRSHPDDYPGINYPSKCLRNLEIRYSLQQLYRHRCLVRYYAQLLHYYNCKNMAIMGISEEELTKFNEDSENEIVIDAEEPDFDWDLKMKPFDPDSLTSMRDINTRVDSLVLLAGGIHERKGGK
ncbi:MAG: hypothetical protein IKG81_03060 [Bacteroidales bacterium]|nr:hypothetical protein [Bacteroidales bacterium]